MNAAGGPRVVLVGPPGAEVRATAEVVARSLGLPLVDTDALVEQSAGTTVAALFLDRGEDAFRTLEREAVARALADPGVVALGGGAVADPGTRARLAELRRDGTAVVVLDVSLAHAVPRLGFNAPRPVGLGNPRAQWQALLDERRPWYDEVASHRVDTDDREVEAVAGLVLALLDPEEGTTR